MVFFGAWMSAAMAQVINGGFETGDFSGWHVQPAQFGSDFGVTGTHFHSGKFGAFFSVFDGLVDQIYQNFNATVGTNYVLSFWVDNQVHGGRDQVFVAWESLVLYRESPHAGWTQVQFNVTAHSSAPELRIGGFDTNDTSYIDDVSLNVFPSGPPQSSAGSVNAVPEPAPLAVLSISAFGFLRRRRSR